MKSGTNEKRHNWKLKQLIIETLKGNQTVSQMNVRAENEFFQFGNSYWMYLLIRIVNNNERYCLMSVLSLYFYFWYIIDDFTKKNEFFLPKGDRLIHLLISIVNNKCKYPWLCFPLIEASFSQRKLIIRQKKKEFYISSGACSLNLLMKFAYNNMKNYIPGMDRNRTLIPINSVEKTWLKELSGSNI